MTSWLNLASGPRRHYKQECICHPVVNSIFIATEKKIKCWGKAVTPLLNKLKVNWQREAYSKIFHFISISGLNIMEAKSFQNPLFRPYNKSSLRELHAWRALWFSVTMEINLFGKSAIHNTAAFLPKEFPFLSENAGWGNKHWGLGAQPPWHCLRPPSVIPFTVPERNILRGSSTLSYAAGSMGFRKRPFLCSFSHEFI